MLVRGVLTARPCAPRRSFRRMREWLRDAPTTTQAGNRGHARIVPPVHTTFVHQLQQLALAEHRVVELQSCELDLRGRVHITRFVHQPVVDVARVLELQRTQRTRDAFDGVAQTVREVVQRVDAPVVAAPVMMRMTNTQQQRITHHHVRMRHVDLRPQHARTIGELAGLHATQQIEILFHRPVAPRTRRARRGHRAAIGPDLLFVLIVDIGLAVLHQTFGDVVELLEIVRRVVFPVPLEAQPLHVALDRLHVPHVFRSRIGVVETQVAGAAELLRDTEVRQIDFACPMCRKPFGSGGTRGRPPTEAAGGDIVATISRMKSRRGAGVVS